MNILSRSLLGVGLSMLIGPTAWADSNRLEAQFPALLDDGQLSDAVILGTAPASLTLSSDTKIMAFFISEDTSYQNTVGWYDASTDPTNAANLNVIWANTSEKDSGGLLKIGRPDNLGHFDAGTELGFYLTAAGYTEKNSKQNDTSTTTTYFSDQALNPDGISHLMRAVLADEGLLVLAWNDGSGEGFSDVVFVLDIGIDNARQIAAGAPEPGEWALMLVGSTTLIGLIRKRRRQTLTERSGIVA
ncbi:MAG: DUF4114 domain-containing protein [Gammaproteobacteria bacterium]|nr:DUF4114 domain-containing protein [Gammaproteobacteria bacterium]MCP5136669.1 DUF4114 domain-containing protein [Gammaproteobacteria bacterium]